MFWDFFLPWCGVEDTGFDCWDDIVKAEVTVFEDDDEDEESLQDIVIYDAISKIPFMSTAVGEEDHVIPQDFNSENDSNMKIDEVPASMTDGRVGSVVATGTLLDIEALKMGITVSIDSEMGIFSKLLQRDDIFVQEPEYMPDINFLSQRITFILSSDSAEQTEELLRNISAAHPKIFFQLVYPNSTQIFQSKAFVNGSLLFSAID